MKKLSLFTTMLLVTLQAVHGQNCVGCWHWAGDAPTITPYYVGTSNALPPHWLKYAARPCVQRTWALQGLA